VGILNPGEVSGKSDSGVDGVKVGQLVTCKVVVNWGLQRSPVMVCDVEPTASAMVTPAAAASASAETAAVDVPAIAKMRGTVQRVKTRIKGGGSDGTGYELTEIALTSLVNSVGEEVGIVLPQPVFFFCDNREVKPLEEINRDSMQVGDEVEFLGITAINVAVGAAILPKKVVESGVSIVNLELLFRIIRMLKLYQHLLLCCAQLKLIAFNRCPLLPQIVFKRNPVNAQLKVTQAKVGIRGIVMAEGPPDEGKSVGFAAGWRETPQVDGLPWSHLLPHLSSSPASLSVAAPVFVPSEAILAAIKPESS
jgi:hypothetical protein